MPKFAVIAISLGLALAACSGPRPHPYPGEPLRSRAERTDYAETSSYRDVMAMVEALVRMETGLHATTFGETVEGRPLPLVVWGASEATPEAVEATGKTRVLVFANIHAGEVAGKEALLVLLRDLALGEHAAWADSLVLLVAPIYNADGNERVALDNRPLQLGPLGGMGQRPNAQGLDLNRDFMKLAAPESRALVGLFRTYDPHVIVDLHTTNGTLHAYHLTYAPPLHPNTPPAIDAELWDRWLPAVTQRIEERDGWLFYHYGNVPGAFGEPASAPRGWYSFDARPRFGTNYAGLRNRFGILSEVYSYAPFEERIAASRRFVEEVVEYAAAHASQIRRLTGEADATPVVGDSLAVRSAYASLPEPVVLQLGAADTVAHPVTGEPMLRRLDVRTPEAMPAFIRFAPAEKERAPAAYLVPRDLTVVTDLLDAHGIDYYPAVASSPVEVFEITEAERAERPFQDRTAQRVVGYYGTLDDAPRDLVYVVPVDQPLGRVAFMLLEPRSEDGLAAWGVLPADSLAPGRYWPIRRIHGALPPR